MLVHIFHFYFYKQNLDFGASPFLFMFAIAKITFFTYAVRERNVNPAVFVNQYHRYCITEDKFPNYLEYLSYIYFFPSAIYGPCFQIKDYLIPLVKNGITLDERQVIIDKPFYVNSKKGILAIYEPKENGVYKPVILFGGEDGNH